MIPRLKGIIAHSHDTKLLGEDGEGVTAGWGTRPSPKTKPVEEDPRNTPTRGWGNIPKLKKDPTLAHGWGYRPNPRRGRWSGPGKVCTHLMVDKDQTRCCGDTTDRYSYGYRGPTNEGQTNGWMHSVFR